MYEYIPGLANVPVTKSFISSIDGKKGILAYRGYPIEQLVEHSNFEEVVMLILNGKLPSNDEIEKFKIELHKRYRIKTNIRKMMWCLPPNSDPMSILQMSVSSMQSFYPDALASYADSSMTQNALLRIISTMSTLVTTWQHIRHGYDPNPPMENMDYACNFLYMLSGKMPDEEIVKIFDQCLILHAEHTINASTFSAMVTGSTLGNPFAAICSAIGTLAGSLHGGANNKVIKMIDKIGKVKNVRPFIKKKLEKNEVIWGMGHREYKVKDPRATILENIIKKYIKKTNFSLSKRFEIALETEEVCKELLSHKGIYPNVDFYSGIVYSEIMDIPYDQFTPIFAIARTVGWIAHWEEQVNNNRIFRPTQIYIGEKLRDY